jgi:hypothetical protein
MLVSVLTLAAPADAQAIQPAPALVSQASKLAAAGKETDAEVTWEPKAVKKSVPGDRAGVIRWVADQGERERGQAPLLAESRDGNRNGLCVAISVADATRSRSRAS